MLFKKTKVSHNDYTPSMLPQTRRAVFFDVLQLHWQKLLGLGLVLLICFLPVLFLTVFRDILHTGLYAAADRGDPQAAQAVAQLYIYAQLLHGVILIPLLAIFCIGLSGVMRVLRQYAWEENVHFSTDFFRGIRENWRQTAAIACIAGILYVLCLALYYTVTAYQNAVLTALCLLPVGISLLVALPVLLIALVMIPIYTNRLWATLKNAFYVYTQSLLKLLGVMLLCISIWIPAFLPNFYCHIFGSLAAVVLTPIILLIWSLFCYDRFDLHINRELCPELIGRGTFHP